MKYAIELLVTGVLKIIDVAETFEKAIAIGLHMRRQNEHHFPDIKKMVPHRRRND